MNANEKLDMDDNDPLDTFGVAMTLFMFGVLILALFFSQSMINENSKMIIDIVFCLVALGVVYSYMFLFNASEINEDDV